MKKIIFLLLLTAASFGVNAQSTKPRWGTGANNDNTGRVLTYAYFDGIIDGIGADSTISLTPNAYSTTVRVALVDSLYFRSPNVKKSYASDRITVIAVGASGTKVKFANGNFISAGTATLSTNGRAVINFVFDGAKWVETGRYVQ